MPTLIMTLKKQNSWKSEAQEIVGSIICEEAGTSELTLNIFTASFNSAKGRLDYP